MRLTRRWSAAANGFGPAPPRTHLERLTGPRSASAAERSASARPPRRSRRDQPATVSEESLGTCPSPLPSESVPAPF